jgi:hypothetical protein
MGDILNLKQFLASLTNRQFAGFDAHQKVTTHAVMPGLTRLRGQSRFGAAKARPPIFFPLAA